MVRMDPAFIARLHVADLNTKFSSSGLDLLEMRALYASLPLDFKNDGERQDEGFVCCAPFV